MIATITFEGGTQITAEKSGDCYIVPSKPEFPDPLGAVTIESEEGDKEYADAMLIECASIDGQYWFAFMETPEDVKLHKKIEELEERIAIMTEGDYDGTPDWPPIDTSAGFDYE